MLTNQLQLDELLEYARQLAKEQKRITFAANTFKSLAYSLTYADAVRVYLCPHLPSRG